MLDSVKKLENDYDNFISNRDKQIGDIEDKIDDNNIEINKLKKKLSDPKDIDSYLDINREIEKKQKEINDLKVLKSNLKAKKFNVKAYEKSVIDETTSYLKNKEKEVLDLCKTADSLNSDIWGVVDKSVNLIHEIYRNETMTDKGYWTERNISNEIDDQTRFFLKDVVDTSYYRNHYMKDKGEDKCKKTRVRLTW
ncbi:hypothetical protein [Anaerococcus hydrogenalis]|uniref:Uncharacterized protein n=1 Tax=Anaerococcus hydrogenalis TaxID=33029 RepID=A0A2N6UKX1_9FIRM|nr:hypothetical protein [Anaerococcus hydrogenalis]MDK7694459.1 hypothetical protein [Anaerococcus hydrogenalis]MDK7696237.1 hypothetical protein [Anaerococcus hydrogenalis]MDK7707486.1 hypothetical protein [Anaerococcus hydrogenalis]PMC82501.1 hypothetical protein CJ192_01865 [Anaerococcus hydrogenalis]